MRKKEYKEYEEYKEFEERSQEPGGAGYAKRWERIDCCECNLLSNSVIRVECDR